MTISATTTAPDEVKRLFDEYADVLQMYANDQWGMARRNIGKRNAELRATLYEEIANEIRSIQFTALDNKETK